MGAGTTEQPDKPSQPVNLYDALLAFAEAHKQMLEREQPGVGKWQVVLSWNQDAKKSLAYFGWQ